MISTVSKKKGTANFKFVLIVMGSLLLCLVVYLNYAFERNDLSHRLNRSLSDRNDAEYQLNEMRKNIIPLKNEIHDLRAMLAVLRDKEISSHQAVTDITEKPPLLSENSDTLSGENIKKHTGKSDKKTARGGVTAKKYKIADPEKGLSRVKEHIKNIEDQNVSLSEKVNRLTGLLEAKEKELLQINKDNAGVKEDLETAVKAQAVLRTELDANLSSVNTLRAQFSQKEADLAKFSTTKDNLENRVVELNDKLAALTKTNDFLESQVSQYQKEKSSLEGDIDKIKEELTKQIVINDSLNKKVTEFTDTLNSKEQERASLMKELEQLRGSKAKLESEMEALKSSRLDNENQVAQLKAQLKESNSSYESIRNTVTQLSTFLTKRESELNAMQQEVIALKDNLENTASEKKVLLLSLKEKENNVSDLNASLTRAESQLITLQSELASSKDRQKKTIQQLTELTSINSSLQQRLLTISQDLEPLGVEADPYKRKADELRKKVEVQLDLDEEEGPKKPEDEE